MLPRSKPSVFAVIPSRDYPRKPKCWQGKQSRQVCSDQQQPHFNAHQEFKTPFLISIRDSVLALPSADRDRAAAVERNCSGPARPFAGFIARFQNSPRERTKALGGISGVSRFASHDDQFGMGAFRNAGQVFQGKCCV